jgi:hypothetical protein
VKVALVRVLAHAAALLQQVRVNGRADDGARVVKVNADEFALMAVVRRGRRKVVQTGEGPFATSFAQPSSRDARQTHKARRVVVLDGGGVAKGFEDGVGLQKLALQLALCMEEVRGCACVVC